MLEVIKKALMTQNNLISIVTMWNKVNELSRENLSQQQIAIKLGIHRDTVRRYQMMNESEFNEFRLDERYNYHKQIALKQYDLYQDYSPGHISQLEKLFGGAKKRNEIEDQIFRGEYTEDSARCFDKLKRDIKEQSSR